MMEEDKVYSSMMDYASKAAAAVGIILGAGYVSGFFINLTIYGALQSPWVTSLIDLQGMIKDGLPLVMLYMFVFVSNFFLLRSLKQHRYLLSILCAVIFTGAVLSWFTPDISEVSLVTRGLTYAAVLIGIVGTGILSWSLHGFIEGQRSSHILMNVLAGTALILCVVPAAAGYLAAKDLKFGRERASFIINEKNEEVGMLIGVVGNKYVVLDCVIPYQVWMEEVSSKFKVRKAVGSCNPSY